MTSELEQRFKRATAWAHGLINLACRFRLAPGPFKTLRKLPLMAVSRAMELQLLFLLWKK